MPATGKITQVIGSTFDVEFPEDQLPEIYNAVTINFAAGDVGGMGGRMAGDGAKGGNGQSDSSATGTMLTGEVASHLGGGKVRAVALGL